MTIMKMTVQELVAHVRHIVQQAVEAGKYQPSKEEQPTVDDAFIHMIATFEAEDYFEQLQPKEFAEFLKQGIPAIDMEQVVMYIGRQHEMIIDQIDEVECLKWHYSFLKRVQYFWEPVA